METDKIQNIELDTNIVQPSDFTDPDALYAELVKIVRRNSANNGDLELLHRAYMTAKNAHMDQKRKSGEPYVTHPVCVAIILANLGLDLDTIMAGLLHDIVEDTILHKDQLQRIFGKDVAGLVDGVTKLTALDIGGMNNDEKQAENLRKMFMAMSHDIRVIIVKLADRLHNMRTLQYQSPEKQVEKSRETLDIYSPIAQRLGISKIKDEMDDIALSYLEPEEYADLKEKLSAKNSNLGPYMQGLIDEVSEHIADAGISATINGRVKHLFSIYNKMKKKNKTLDQIYDIFAVRIIVDSIKDCYAALGIIHEHYKPIPGRFKDYIAMPKPNMYQSLHTTVIGKDGTPFEIQIRTYEMHRIAEYGIAAHWQYKERGGSETSDQTDETYKMNWLHQIMELQKENDNREFLALLKSDLNLFSETVYCFTPTGQVKNLPAGSTPIDFAYAIHTAVGNKMVGARVNDQIVNIDYKLQNGDRVEIITSQNSRGPSMDWLKLVRSTSARNKINQWFKSTLKEENIAIGKEKVEKYCKAKQIDFSEINRPDIVDKVCARYSANSWDSILATIGHGGLKEGQIINRMVDEYNKVVRKEVTDEQVLEVLSESSSANHPKAKISNSNHGITVKGVHDLAVRFSRCCNPVPGDEIVGFVTRGRGVTIHRTDCVNIISMPPEDRARLIPAEWQSSATGSKAKYVATLRIYVTNRIGLLVDITRTITEKGIDIRSLDTHAGKNGRITINLSFETVGAEEVNAVIEKLRQVDGIVDIERATG
ncbi:MAG: bifunctional (p)ppGpp synthetase/guanosine-3',5'-bis(diphosphate) 3'-pyrophosphohydrolase [Lachnospiraceae bacterium]|nr:bifunctional (p)ppGpp synthetase/guanosine-3',5'-bis(diphosphate) 3'-pyrophosphohydrolase [Lachnospiraceae bacterium]